MGKKATPFEKKRSITAVNNWCIAVFKEYLENNIVVGLLLTQQVDQFSLSESYQVQVQSQTFYALSYNLEVLILCWNHYSHTILEKLLINDEENVQRQDDYVKHPTECENQQGLNWEDLSLVIHLCHSPLINIGFSPIPSLSSCVYYQKGWFEPCDRFSNPIFLFVQPLVPISSLCNK